MNNNWKPIQKAIFETRNIGHLPLKNRVVMGPICNGLEAAGKMRDLVHFYQQRASGDVSLIIVGGFAFNKIGAWSSYANVFDSFFNLSGHKLITDAIHEKGAYAFLQLSHAGMQAGHIFAMSASEAFDENGNRIAREMPHFIVRRTIKQYVRAAAMAKKAGYDGIDLDAGNNRLLNSFLTPGMNTRTDEYGGSEENRMRILIEIIDGINQNVGKDFIIGLRMSLMDFELHGKDWKETVDIAKAAEKAGVDYFAFTLGTGRMPIPTYHGLTPEGVWNPFISMMSEEVSKPVLFGFNLNNPELINQVLQDNKKGLVELSQALITDANWVKKIAFRLEHMVIPCTRCYQSCNGFTLKKGQCISCMMNPLLFEENVMQNPVATPKKILVIGGGPSGLTAAIYAAKRGHEVTIYEEQDDIGGQVLYCAKVPHKRDYRHLVEHLSRLCERYEVTIETGHRVTIDEVDEIRLNFDDVILATGMTVADSWIPGISGNNMYSYREIFQAANKPVGQRIVVLGNNGIALDCAIYLLSQTMNNVDNQGWLSTWGVGDPREHRAGIVGVIPKSFVPEREITLIDQNPEKGPLFIRKNKNFNDFEMRWLRILGIHTFHNANLDNYESPTLHISFGKRHENPTSIPADTVIVANKLVPNNALFEGFKEAGLTVHVIGAATQKEDTDFMSILECLKQGIKKGNQI